MTFDPLKFYEDGKRRESRWGAVTPFILVGLLLLVMGVDGYLGYKSAHPRPKSEVPAPVVINPMRDTELTCSADGAAPSDEGCQVYRNQSTVAQLPTRWYSCNAGMEVTDVHSCPEYQQEHPAFLWPHKHKPSWADDHACYRETLDANRNPVDTAIVCPEDEPRHKRKPAFPVPPEDSDIGSGSNTIGEWFCDKCSEHQMTETTKDTQVFWEEKAATTPADITNLMERIVPTKPAPDCKMPADVDVCPAQTLDKKVKP